MPVTARTDSGFLKGGDFLSTEHSLLNDVDICSIVVLFVVCTLKGRPRLKKTPAFKLKFSGWETENTFPTKLSVITNSQRNGVS